MQEFSKERRNFFLAAAKSVHQTIAAENEILKLENSKISIYKHHIEKQQVLTIIDWQKPTHKLKKNLNILHVKSEGNTHEIAPICSLIDTTFPQAANPSTLLLKSTKQVKIAVPKPSVFSKLILLTPAIPTPSQIKNISVPTLLITEAHSEESADELLKIAPLLPTGSDVFAVEKGALKAPCSAPMELRILQFIQNGL